MYLTFPPLVDLLSIRGGCCMVCCCVTKSANEKKELHGVTAGATMEGKVSQHIACDKSSKNPFLPDCVASHCADNQHNLFSTSDPASFAPD